MTKFNKIWGLAGAFGAALLAAQPASAVTATFDFVGIADGATFYSTAAPDTARTGFEGNWNKPDGIDASIGAVVGDNAGILDKASGISVKARAENSTGAGADAFFDSNIAGLGVCSYGVSKSCKSGVFGAITGDDNLNREEESLIFTFNQMVRVNGLTIYDADHNKPTGDFTIGGDVYTITNGRVDAALLDRLPLASEFILKYVQDGPQLYVGDFTVTTLPPPPPPAPVPLPAGMVLLGSALAGLGFMGRRRVAH